MTVRGARSFVDQWWRVGGLVGILFVVLFIIGAFIIEGDTPMSDDSASDIRKYFVDHPHKFLVGEFLIAFAFVFFLLPFASALRSFLGRAEGPAAIWSRLVFAGALLMTAVGAAASGLQGALAYSAAGFADDNILKTIVNANYYTFTTAFPFLAALMVLSASVVILRTGALWRWLGGFGVIFAIAAVISTLAVLNDDPMGPLGVLGFIVFIALGVWILIAGAGMLMKQAPPEHGATS